MKKLKEYLFDRMRLESDYDENYGEGEGEIEREGERYREGGI